MSLKAKRKFPILWVRPFDTTVEMPFEESEDRLRSLAQPKASYWNPSSREVEVRKTSDNAYDFEVCWKGYTNSSSYTKAKCAGVIFRDSWSGKTTVRGQFSVGRFTPLFLLFLSTAAIGFLLTMPSHYAFYGVIFGIYALFLGLQFQRDYRQFQTQVYEAFHR